MKIYRLFAATFIAVLLGSSVSTGIQAAEPGALMQAVLAGDAIQVRAALAAGDSPTAIDPSVNHSALYVAVIEGGPRDTAVLDLLLERKPDLEAEDTQSGLTPLMAAMVVTQTGPFAVIERAKTTALVERLLKAGANPNRTAKSGDTPLLVAVGMNNLEAVKLLLAGGADPAQRSAGKASALQLARAPGRSPEMLDALRTATPVVLSARSAGTEAVPAEDLETAPVPEKSSLSGWFIGGAAVAAAGVIAALVANQKKKNAPPVGPGTQPPLAVAPQPVPLPTPQPLPQPLPQPVPQPQPLPPGSGGQFPPFIPTPIPSGSPAPQVQIVQASFFPPVPQFGQVYAVRVSLKNLTNTNYDGTLTIVSNRGKTMFPTMNMALAPQQQIDVESPGLLFDGKDMTLGLTATGLVSQRYNGISYTVYSSRGTLALPPLPQPVPPPPAPGDPTVRLKTVMQAVVLQSGQVVSTFNSTSVQFPQGKEGQNYVVKVALQNSSVYVLGAALWGLLEGDRLIYAERLNIGPNGSAALTTPPIVHDGNARTFTLFAVGSGIPGDVHGASVRTAPDVFLQNLQIVPSGAPIGPVQPNNRPLFTQTVDTCLQVNMQSSDSCPAPWYFGMQVANKCNDRRLIETCSLRDGWGHCTTNLLLPNTTVNTPSCGQPGANGYRIRSAAPVLTNGVVGYPLPPMLYGPSMESRAGWPR